MKKTILLQRILLPLLALFTGSLLYAQTDSVIINPPNEKLNKQFIIDGIKDATHTITRPVHWKTKNWLTFSAFAGTVGVTMLLDKQIKNFALHNRSSFANNIANAVEPIGVYGLMVFPVIYATGIVIKNPKVESIGLRGGKAMAINAGITFVAKNIIRRQRPNISESPFNYALPFSKAKYTSMPSAHSSIAFTLATAFAQEFPQKKWVAPVAYSLATLTAASRIYHNRHWASDIIIGAALGHFVTKAVYASDRKRKQRNFSKYLW